MESKSIESRIAEIHRSAIPSRLLKGAENLGTAWRSGQRCLSGFARICPCPTPTEFCQVKLKWIALAEEYYDGMPFGLSGYEPFYVIEAMTVSQFKVTKLTALIQIPVQVSVSEKEVGVIQSEIIRVGYRGTTWKTIVDLSDLQDDDVALAVGVDAVVKLQKAEFGK
jgi:hypothetical protein